MFMKSESFPVYLFPPTSPSPYNLSTFSTSISSLILLKSDIIETPVAPLSLNIYVPLLYESPSPILINSDSFPSILLNDVSDTPVSPLPLIIWVPLLYESSSPNLYNSSSSPSILLNEESDTPVIPLPLIICVPFEFPLILDIFPSIL